MKRRWIAGLLAVALSVSAPAAASAPPSTQTVATHNGVDSFIDVLPACDPGGPLYATTLTYHAVEHVTSFAGGGLHLSFVQTGTFIADPLDPGGERFTGRFTTTGAWNMSSTTIGGSSTFNLRAAGSAGSGLRHHVNSQFIERPDGSARQFVRCR